MPPVGSPNLADLRKKMYLEFFVTDKRSIQPLYDLDTKLQAIRDPDNVILKKLKEAVFWAIKQCDT